ncbi:MAG: ASKHA domain-containing protein, partial [Herbinix sp.]|nr:ASKHA domain-containing protein [Herbinix sp.]
RDELRRGFLYILQRQGINFELIKKIVISGNTTMIHLLMGYPCDGLGSYPFTPVNLGLINTFTDDLFDIANRIPVMILPGISVFVGADITAGLLANGIDREDKPCLFIDLGTNGEMAVGNRDKILVTSTAAGPAFEGGNISCGIGSVSGAICHVTFEKGQLSYDTINAQPAVGICGTGVIELVSELLDEGIIDWTGLLMDPYFDEGYEIAGMKFIQKDIRELQMAKSAIRAGVDILVGRFGISYEQIDKVYIAGGFGYHLDIDKAINIGLLPKALVNKARAVGNTSLSGAIDALIDSDANARMNHIVSTSEEIHLSNEEDFNDLFVKYMSFD